MRELTQQQRAFCFDVYKDIPQGQAYMRHYKVKSMAVASVCASQLLRTPKIVNFLQELRQKAEDDSVASVEERKQILTEMARGRLVDYLTCGPDRDLIDIGPESPNPRALKEVTSATVVGDDGAAPTVYTKIKLHDPARAIDILNKMDGANAPEKHAHLVLGLTAEDLTDDELARIASGYKPSRSSVETPTTPPGP